MAADLLEWFCESRAPDSSMTGRDARSNLRGTGGTAKPVEQHSHRFRINEVHNCGRDFEPIDPDPNEGASGYYRSQLRREPRGSRDPGIADGDHRGGAHRPAQRGPV